MHTYFVLCVLVQYNIISFVAQIVPTLAFGSSLGLAPFSFQYDPILLFLWMLFTFWPYKMLLAPLPVSFSHDRAM